MEEVKRYLEERKNEMLTHLRLLEVLEKWSVNTANLNSDLDIEVRQVLIIKASILVHLYNIVESVMAKLCEVIENVVHTHHPKNYSDELFNNWIDTNMRVSNEINISNITKRAQIIGRELLENSGWSKLEIKKTDGNWDDQRIINFTKKYDIEILYPRGFKSKLMKPFFDNLTIMQYVRKRRNDLAHGFITFEEGADRKTHAELSNIANLTISFMELTVNACQQFVSNNAFLKSPANEGRTRLQSAES